MRTAEIAICLALLATVALSQDGFGGASGFDIRSGPSQADDCYFRVFVMPYADKVVIEQQYRPINVLPSQPIPDTCHVPNLVFKSFFLNDQLGADDQLVVIPPTNVTNPVWDVEFTAEWLNKNNGTACIHLPQSNRPGVEQYLCSFDYAGTPLYFATYGTGNFTFDTTPQGFIVGRQNTQDFYIHAYIIGFNTSFPNISTSLYASCGSTVSIINSLDTTVTVSTVTDLSANFERNWLGYTLVKKLTAGVGDYLVIPHTSQNFLFAPGSGNGCWSMGIKYSDILPDMAYCAGGCKVSFILRDNRGIIYVMETTGIQTIDTTVGGGSGSGSGSGSGNGSGSGSGNGNGNGNGGAASSASSMVFNGCLLLISFAYLAWL